MARFARALSALASGKMTRMSPASTESPASPLSLFRILSRSFNVGIFSQQKEENSLVKSPWTRRDGDPVQGRETRGCVHAFASHGHQGTAAPQNTVSGGLEFPQNGRFENGFSSVQGVSLHFSPIESETDPVAGLGLFFVSV